MMSRDLLLEIGTEEVPAHFMPGILQQLKVKAADKFDQLHIDVSGIRTLGTPRRITLLIKGMAEKQADISIEHKGPSTKIAFDKAGNPTKAAVGFARGKNIPVDKLTVKDGYVYAVVHEQGKATAKLLSVILPELIENLNFPKTMRWADLDFHFVRPIRWIVALFGDEIINFTIANVKSGNKTRGHRFLSDGEHIIPNASEYEEVLKNLHIIVDQIERRTMIEKQIKELAEENNGIAQITDELLEEVTYLVEYPTALCGRFEDKYLQLPKEAVITPMREHQRYFPVVDAAGRLLPLFITVRNGGTKSLPTVQHGNERVLRARLADAQFFFDEDRKKKLADYLEKLKAVVFQEGLGSVYDKTLRLEQLAQYLGRAVDATPVDLDAAKRAAFLSKADLVTGMVCEFTELQGIMGREYALLDGESGAVATAIDEQYMPRFAGDRLPGTVAGRLVSLSDKIDNITATFSRGLVPTGSQDPFALRRQALGIVNILIEGQINISLAKFIDKAMSLLDINSNKKTGLLNSIVDFIKSRFNTVLTADGIRYDVIDAVSGTIDDIYAAYKKAKVINTKVLEGDLSAAIQAFIRVSNIAKTDNLQMDAALFTCREEKALYDSYITVKKAVAEYKYDYAGVIDELTKLTAPIDMFFDKVMVMDKDEVIKNNRLGLLKNIDNLVKKTADFSRIVL